MDEYKSQMTSVLEAIGVNDQAGVLLLVTVLVSLCTLVYLTRFNGKAKKLPPGRMGIPFFTDDTKRFLSEKDFLINKTKEYGPICKGRIMGRNTIFISDTAEVKRLLAAEHDLVEAFWPSSTQTMLGTDSVSATYHSAHKKLRRVLNTAFTAKAIRDYLPRIQELAEQFGHKMCTKKPALAHKELQYFTFQAVAELVLGFEESWFSGKVGEAIREAWEPYTMALFCLPIRLPGTTLWKGLNARQFLVRKITESFLQAQKELKHMGPDDNRKIAHKLLEATDEEGRHFTEKELQDICINVLWAGHDTTATSLTQLVALLPKHPEVMQKLKEEQAKIVKEHGTAITDAALREMHYVEAVMKENLRFNVIVGGVPRTALKSFTIAGGKYEVPKGWDLSLMFGLKMREDPVWANAKGDLDVFNFYPDRWLTEDAQKSTTYQPFGAGPRLCLGYPLATAEIKVLLAILARSYTWELVDPTEEWVTFPLAVPKKGLPLKFKQIEQPIV